MRDCDSTDTDLGTVPRVAREVGLHPQVLRRAVNAGKVPAYDVGTAWPRVRRSEVRSWIASTRVRPRGADRAWLDSALQRESRAAGTP